MYGREYEGHARVWEGWVRRVKNGEGEREQGFKHGDSTSVEERKQLDPRSRAPRVISGLSQG